MKIFSLKLVIGLFALAVGIAVVWASGIVNLSNYAGEKEKSFSPANEMLKSEPPNKERSNKVIIQFKGFELYKDWAAKFEITNFTNKPMTYIGFKDKGEFDFCSLTAQRDETHDVTGVKIHAFGSKTRDNCQMSKAVILQTIEPDEKVIFSVSKYEVQDLVDLREKYKNAQIGFEFFTGDEKSREIFWTDDITFPAETN